MLGFPELRRLCRDLKHSQRSAYSCGMYSNLRTQFKAFFLFCFYFKLTPVPAELMTVCLYLQFLSRTLTPPSIRNYLSGVKLLHLFLGVDYLFTKDFILSLTLRGIARSALHTTRRAPPVSPSLLHQLSFFLLLNGDPPVTAYRRMIELVPARRSCPVFLLPGPSGIMPLTKHSFVSQFRACLSAMGISHINRFRGHSFHRGAPSWAFSCGVPGKLIQLYIDWSSDS